MRRSGLDEVRAGQRIDGVGHAGLVGEDLLGAQGQPGRVARWAAPAPRPSRWCAATACRRAPRPAPDRPRARRCCRAAGRSAWSRRSGCGSAASPSAGLSAPKRSRMIRAHSRRAARNLATSSKKLLWPLKKNDSRGANASTSRPACQRRLDVGDAVGEREGDLLHGGASPPRGCGSR